MAVVGKGWETAEYNLCSEAIELSRYECHGVVELTRVEESRSSDGCRGVAVLWLGGRDGP